MKPRVVLACIPDVQGSPVTIESWLDHAPDGMDIVVCFPEVVAGRSSCIFVDGGEGDLGSSRYVSTAKSLLNAANEFVGPGVAEESWIGVAQMSLHFSASFFSSFSAAATWGYLAITVNGMGAFFLRQDVWNLLGGTFPSLPIESPEWERSVRGRLSHYDVPCTNFVMQSSPYMGNRRMFRELMDHVHKAFVPAAG